MGDEEKKERTNVASIQKLSRCERERQRERERYCQPSLGFVSCTRWNLTPIALPAVRPVEFSPTYRTHFHANDPTYSSFPHFLLLIHIQTYANHELPQLEFFTSVSIHESYLRNRLCINIGKAILYLAVYLVFRSKYLIFFFVLPFFYCFVILFFWRSTRFQRFIYFMDMKAFLHQRVKLDSLMEWEGIWYFICTMKGFSL